MQEVEKAIFFVSEVCLDEDGYDEVATMIDDEIGGQFVDKFCKPAPFSIPTDLVEVATGTDYDFGGNKVWFVAIVSGVDEGMGCGCMVSGVVNSGIKQDTGAGIIVG